MPLMNRPFYRSLLFWFGLPGLVFLLWGWQDSGKAVRTMTWNGRGAARQVDQWNGSIRVLYVADPALYGGPMHRFSFHRSEMPAAYRDKRRLGPLVFAPLFPSLESPRAAPRISYWVVFFLYLMTWIVALAAWQRRKARLLKLHAAP